MLSVFIHRRDNKAEGGAGLRFREADISDSRAVGRNLCECVSWCCGAGSGGQGRSMFRLWYKGSEKMGTIRDAEPANDAVLLYRRLQ